MKCRACGREMVMILTAAGRYVPCDPPVLTVVTDDGRAVKGRISHFATCPDADRFRKAKKEVSE